MSFSKTLGLKRVIDIFLNYVLDDVDKADKLRAAFQQQGWNISWRDPYVLYSGVRAETLDKLLKDTKVIVTLWSSRAARRLSAARQVLEPTSSALPIFVRLDRRVPPSTYAPVRVFDLSDWDGVESHAGLQNLLSYLRKLVATSPHTAAPPASIEELSLSEIQESARQGIRESEVARSQNDARFKGVFISYRRNEAAAYAGRLYDRLAARFGKERVFIDTENVGWGEDFVEAITSAAESCVVMIALVSPRWSRGAGGQTDLDDYVRLEVATALGRKIRVIPILIQGASMPSPRDLPEDLAPLARLNAIPLSDDARWERDVEDLMKTLEKLLEN